MNATLIDLISPSALEAMDLSSVKRYNKLVDHVVSRASTPSKRKEAEGWRLREDLGALCYDGDPQAPVVYLQANPSHGDDATRQTHYQPHSKFPLSVAGTHIHPPTRSYYHDEVFRHLQMEGVSLQQISRKLLKVELCPWASKKWPGSGKLEEALGQFPSRKPIAQFVEDLVERGAIFIIARAWTPWFKAVPSLEPLVGSRVFKSKAPVSAFISSGSYPDGWPLIVSTMRS